MIPILKKNRIELFYDPVRFSAPPTTEVVVHGQLVRRGRIFAQGFLRGIVPLLIVLILGVIQNVRLRTRHK